MKKNPFKNFPSFSKPDFSSYAVLIWSIAALFFLYEFFLRTFLGAISKQVIPELSLTPSKFASLATAFYFVYGIMQIPVGEITEKIGLKRSMLLATATCCAGALCFSFSTTYWQAFIARLLMGFGGSFAFICLLVVTIENFSKQYLASLVGAGQFIGTIGALCAGGPLAALVVGTKISWHYILLAMAFWGLLLFLLSLIFFKKREANAQNIVSRKRKKSTVKRLRQLFKSSQAWFIACYSAGVFISVAVLGAVWGVIYLQTIGYSQQSASTVVSFDWLGFACGCPLLGVISDHTKKRKPVMIVCALLGLFVLMILIYFPFHMSFAHYILFFILGFAGAGQSIGFTIITEHVRPHLKSLSLGLNSGMITLVAALIPIIIGIIIQTLADSPLSDISDYSYHYFSIALSPLPTMTMIALIIVIFFVDETYCADQHNLTEKIET